MLLLREKSDFEKTYSSHVPKGKTIWLSHLWVHSAHVFKDGGHSRAQGPF